MCLAQLLRAGNVLTAEHGILRRAELALELLIPISLCVGWPVLGIPVGIIVAAYLPRQFMRVPTRGRRLRLLPLRLEQVTLHVGCARDDDPRPAGNGRAEGAPHLLLPRQERKLVYKHRTGRECPASLRRGCLRDDPRAVVEREFGLVVRRDMDR